MLILIIAAGPDKGRIYELFDDQGVILGRQGDQVCLTDSRVSRHHAKLTAEGDQWFVEDLGSMHGTLHNKEPIGGRTALSDGDQIKIGRTVLVLARMPVEHVERAALLDGPASTGSMVGHRARRRLNMKKVGAVAACGLLLLGGGAGALVQFGWPGMMHGAERRVALGSKRMYRDVTGGASAKAGGASVKEASAGGGAPTLSGAEANQGATLASAASANKSQVVPGLSSARSVRLIKTAVPATQPTASREKELAELAALNQALKKQQAMIAPMSQQIRAATAAADASAKSLAALRKAMRAKGSSKALASLSQKLDAALAELKRQTSTQQSMAQLRSAIEADASHKSLAALSAKLNAALKKLQQPTNDNQKVLEAIAALKKSLPASTNAQLQKILAKLDHQPTKRQLIVAVRQAFANDSHASATAMADASEPGGATVAADASGGHPSGIATSTDTTYQPPGKLTKTQMAYKQAFETGRKVVIGQHIDPATGQKSGGRVLDPRAARLAGITSWRQWYTLDDLAQRLALQQQAAKYVSRSSAALIQIPNAAAGHDSGGHSSSAATQAGGQ